MDIAGEWIAVGPDDALNGARALVTTVAQRAVCLPDDASSDPDLRIEKAYGLIWLCFGEPKRPLFSMPEFGAPGGRIVPCGALGVRTSPLRAIENFLDMGHFPYIHTGVLGAEPDTEVVPYSVEWREAEDEVWALDCRFRQPKSAPGADAAQETLYRYRVVSPFNVILYKTAPVGGFDVICLFVQPLAPERICAHMLMVLKDASSTMTEMIHFQQMIFGQDKPILENHMPRLMPLVGLREKSARADAMSMAYRKWLSSKGWSYGAAIEAS